MRGGVRGEAPPGGFRAGVGGGGDDTDPELGAGGSGFLWLLG